MNYFLNASALKQAVLTSGQVVNTRGYYSANDGGQSSYEIMTPAEYGGAPDELSDFTLSNGNIASLRRGDGGFNVRQFGAVGDGVADDTQSIQAWANRGGNLYGHRGLYRTTGGVLFSPITSINGESAGAGTGGSHVPTLLEEAQEGAFIIAPDEINWNGDEYVFRFENLKADLKAAPSISISNIKIQANRDGAVPAHLLEVINAYDALSIRNVNLNFAHKNYNALRLVEIDGTTFPTLSQTGIIENVVAIGDDVPDASTTPVIYMRRQQEMQMIGVKSFGIATSLVATCERVPISLDNCRGISGLGCSSASTNAIGLDIYCTDVSVDGIVFAGHTFELCNGGAWLIDGFSRNTGANTVSNIEISSPRYQFPQSVAGFIRGSEQCRVYVGTKQVTTSDGATNNLITGYDVNNYTDTVGGVAGNSNVYLALPDAAGQVYRVNRNMGVQRDSGSFVFNSVGAVNEYILKYSASDTSDNGFQMTNSQTGAYLLLEPSGRYVMQPSTTGEGPQIRFNSPSGAKSYSLAYSVTSGDADSGFFIKNNDTNASTTFEPNGDLNLRPDSGSSGLVLRSADGTAYRLTIANGGGSVDITPI